MGGITSNSLVDTKYAVGLFWYAQHIKAKHKFVEVIVVHIAKLVGSIL